MQESMGAIVDRSQEYLGPADRAIIVTRRLLLQAIQTVEDGGDPPGADTSYYQGAGRRAHSPEGRAMARGAAAGDVSGGGTVAAAH